MLLDKSLTTENRSFLANPAWGEFHLGPHPVLEGVLKIPKLGSRSPGGAVWGGRGTLHKNTVIPGPGLGVLSPSDLTALQPGAALDTEFHYVQEPARSRVVGSGRQGQQGPPAGTGRGPEAGREAGAADGGRSSRDRPSAICQPRCAVDSPAATVPPSVTPRTISTSLASGSGRAFVPQGQTRLTTAWTMAPLPRPGRRGGSHLHGLRQARGLPT